MASHRIFKLAFEQFSITFATEMTTKMTYKQPESLICFSVDRRWNYFPMEQKAVLSSIFNS